MFEFENETTEKRVNSKNKVEVTKTTKCKIRWRVTQYAALGFLISLFALIPID